MDEVAAVELRRDVDGQAQPPPGRLDAAGVGYGANKIAPQAYKCFNGPGQDALARTDRRQSFLARWLEPIQFLQLVERGQLRFLGNSHCALALDVGMSPHRADSGSGLAYVASQEQQVGHHLDRFDTVE